MKIIIVPDEGEYTLVPKVATHPVMQFNPYTGAPRRPQDIASDPHGLLVWDGETPMLAAAPPCKVVELPERDIGDDPGRGHSQSVRDYQEGWNDCLDEIERRAK